MRIPLCIVISLVLLSGCKDSSEAKVYTIAREDPPQVDPPETVVTPMAARRLPDSVVNTSGPDPVWEVPESWAAGEGSPMRRGSYTANGTGGSVDIAITSFPGDVGGLLANLNRWRGQIGLPPVAESDLETAVERRMINGREAVLMDIAGPGQSTLAAIFEHEGHSWFFKATGPAASVAEQREGFNRFLNSIRFPDGKSE